MIAVQFSDKEFAQTMNSVVNYSLGFLDGAQKNKSRLMNNIGKDVVARLREFIDSNARVSPETLHHVYEWHRTGSPDARLYDIRHRMSNKGVSFSYTFRQSSSVRQGSTVPFYNKAKIMEEGSPVTIRPVSRQVLRFQVGSEEVFTKGPVTVNNPGGEATNGAFERTIDSFFNNFFTQSYLRTSGLISHLGSLKAFKDGLKKGAGREAGFNAGSRWIVGRGSSVDA